MEKKHIYWTLGLSAIAIAAICVYNNRLPNAKNIKISADGTSDEERGAVEKLPSQKSSSEETFGAHGGGGHHGGGGRHHGGGGRGRRGGWGIPYPLGWGYPLWSDYDLGGVCYMKDEKGNDIPYYCNDVNGYAYRRPIIL